MIPFPKQQDIEGDIEGDIELGKKIASADAACLRYEQLYRPKSGCSFGGKPLLKVGFEFSTLLKADSTEELTTDLLGAINGFQLSVSCAY